MKPNVSASPSRTSNRRRRSAGMRPGGALPLDTEEVEDRREVPGLPDGGTQLRQPVQDRQGLPRLLDRRGALVDTQQGLGQVEPGQEVSGVAVHGPAKVAGGLLRHGGGHAALVLALGLPRHRQLALPDGFGVVLHVAGAREELGELALRRRARPPVVAEDDGAARGRALVEGQDAAGHASGRGQVAPGGLRLSPDPPVANQPVQHTVDIRNLGPVTGSGTLRVWDETGGAAVLIFEEAFTVTSQRQASFVHTYDAGNHNLTLRVEGVTPPDVDLANNELRVSLRVLSLPDFALLELSASRLDPEEGQTADPGTGWDVTKVLAALPPACPVIIHTSNGERATWMMGEFDLGGWQYDRVPPLGDDWIERHWRRVVRRLLKRTR